ncbi:MAG: shikimate dehydrogenase, partial [Dehalococcoidia bacterium]|nr:shikimate dehydrogenase [Dehalococcoidia bacterium]
MTALVGLIGHSVKHSISAAFQQAALDHLGIDARYLVWDVASEGLEAMLVELRQPNHLGANVTIPHKEAVIPLIDEVEQMAGRIGAVNTIVNRDGRLEGLNTDARGFLLALHREAGFDPSGRKAVL